jgi:hypothetical protein
MRWDWGRNVIREILPNKPLSSTYLSTYRELDDVPYTQYLYVQL